MKHTHSHLRNLQPVLSGTFLSLVTNKRNESVVWKMCLIVIDVIRLVQLGEFSTPHADYSLNRTGDLWHVVLRFQSHWAPSQVVPDGHFLGCHVP